MTNRLSSFSTPQLSLYHHHHPIQRDSPVESHPSALLSMDISVTALNPIESKSDEYHHDGVYKYTTRNASGMKLLMMAPYVDQDQRIKTLTK